MRRLALLALLWLAPAAAAQPATVVVRSGEHSGFTRLVLMLPAPGNWRFGRTATGYELRLDRTGIVYDLSRVFDFIRRDRLSALWSDPASGALVLGIGCACHAVAFAGQPAVIVIDIRDGPPVPGSGFETAIDDPAGAPLPPLAGRPALRPRPRPAGIAAIDLAGDDPAGAPLPPLAGRPAVRPRPRPAGIAAIDLASIWKSTEPPGQGGIADLDDTSLPAARLREAIARQIGAAAARGLVEAAQPVIPPAPAVAPEAGPAAPAERPIMAAQAENLRVRDASDDASGTLAADGSACVADSALAFLHDGQGPGFDSLTRLRGRVVGEFDRPDMAAALALAETYLALGFGAEAIGVLDAFDVDDPRRPLLEAVGRIIDGTGAGSLADMAACDALVAMWSVLDEPPPARGQPIASGAIARALSALPPALRRHLGARLADRLLEAGHADTAHAVRAAIARTADPGPALALVDASLAQAAGDHMGAETTLRPVAEANGPLSGLALARLSDSIVDRGGTPDEATRVVLAAMAREQDGTPEGRALARAHARSLAAGDDYDAAFAAAAADDSVTREVWALLATRGTDGALLRHAGRPPVGTTLPPSTRSAIADRLLDLALPELAVAWLDPEPESDDDRLRAARAAFASGDGREAMRLVAGVDGEQAALVRGEAAVLLGLADEAALAFMAAGAEDRATSALWRLRGWSAFDADTVARLPAGSDRLIAALARADAGGSDPAGPTLAGTRQAIDEARDVRAAIGVLLETVGSPASGE